MKIVFVHLKLIKSCFVCLECPADSDCKQPDAVFVYLSFLITYV